MMSRSYDLMTAKQVHETILMMSKVAIECADWIDHTNMKPTAPTAFTTQIDGDHYKSLAIQPAEFCHKNRLGFCESSAIKYLVRHKSKHGRQDLEKAIHFIQLLIEMQYPEEKFVSDSPWCFRQFKDGHGRHIRIFKNGECHVSFEGGQAVPMNPPFTIKDAELFVTHGAWTEVRDGSNGEPESQKPVDEVRSGLRMFHNQKNGDDFISVSISADGSCVTVAGKADPTMMRVPWTLEQLENYVRCRGWTEVTA